MPQIPHSHPVIHQYLAANPADTAAKVLRATIVSHVKRVLAAPDQTYTTTELAKNVADALRLESKRVYPIMNDAAKYELAPYATRGEPVLATKGYNTGKLIRPWLWHAKKDRPAAARPATLDVFAQIREKLQTIEEKLDTLLTRQ